jgi:hypothetical protein
MAEARNAGDALENAHLDAEVKIVDQTAADAHPERRDFVAWLGELFAGHEDKHAFEEGLRRGHVLLTAKVDDLKETRAAEILGAANPLDFDEAERTWRAEGWDAPRSPDSEEHQPVVIIGHSVRSYSLEPTP